jgi:hypothetical protein
MQRFGGYYCDSFSKYKQKEPNAKTCQKNKKNKNDERPQKGCYKKGKKLPKSEFLLKCK